MIQAPRKIVFVPSRLDHFRLDLGFWAEMALEILDFLPQFLDRFQFPASIVPQFDAFRAFFIRESGSNPVQSRERFGIVAQFPGEIGVIFDKIIVDHGFSLISSIKFINS